MPKCILLRQNTQNDAINVAEKYINSKTNNKPVDLRFLSTGSVAFRN